MSQFALRSQQHRLRVNIISTVCCMAFLVVAYITGPLAVVLVVSLAFMVGYIYGRVQLYRTIRQLMCSAHSLPPHGQGAA
jgi:uncharacterized membrane protein YccC